MADTAAKANNAVWNVVGAIFGLLVLIFIGGVIIWFARGIWDAAGRLNAGWNGQPPYTYSSGRQVPQARPQRGSIPTIDCGAVRGIRTINPNTGKPTCFVPD